MVTPLLSSVRMRFVLTGGPTAVFDYAGLRFITDPTLDDPGEYAGGVMLTKTTGPQLPPEGIGLPDVALVSHDQHADNLDRAGRTLLSKIPIALSTADAAERTPGVVGLANWSAVRVGNITVTAVPAQHGPQAAQRQTGTVIGFVLESEGWPTLYVSGDNSSPDVLRDITRRFLIDIALLHVGAADPGRFRSRVSLGVQDAPRVAELLGLARVIPVHADGWTHFHETRQQFAAALEGSDAKLLVPDLGVWTETR